MNRTDDQIDAIVLARDIMLQRMNFYKEAAKFAHDDYLIRKLTFAAAYENAANILTAALNENWERLRNYEGA